MRTFHEWWFEYGSAMRPEENEDYEQFSARIAEAAWENSAKTNWNLAIDSALENAKAKIESKKDGSGKWYKISSIIPRSILKLKKI